jgi:hypothetical protein
VHAGLRRALAVEKSAVAKIGDDNRLQEIKILRRLRSFQLFDTFLLKNEQGRLEKRDNRAQLQCLPFYIEGNRQGADLRRGEENLQMLDAIANQNRNGISFAHAQGEQAVSKLVYPSIQFAVGDLSKAILGGDLDWQLVGVAAQAVAHQQGDFGSHRWIIRSRVQKFKVQR